MVKRDTYTYKQILIGLRKEFIEAQRKLDKLEEHVVISAKNIEDYYFNLYKSPDSNELPELTLDKKINTGRTYNLIERLRDFYGYRTPTRAFIVKDNNGNYHTLRKPSFKKDDFNMRVSSQEKFKELADELLNSDFAKYMTLDDIVKAVDSQAIPRIVPKSFQFDLNTEKSVISYLGREDVLEFASCRKPQERWEPLTQEHLDYVSAIEFPKSSFPEYHQNIIDKSIDDDKQIVLCDSYVPKIHTKLQIHDTGKQLVLSNIKK